jgi:hypothetical protein
MTTKNLLLSVGLLAGFVLPLVAADRPTASAVEVTFVEPNKFTDLKDRYTSLEEANPAYLKELQEHLQRVAARRLAPGQRLVVSITNVDMAGDFEPWRSPQYQDVRIVKDIYPPRIDLSFQLLDAGGAVIAQGQRELRDLAFNMRISGVSNNDPLRHEKALLDDWIRREFRPAKK